MGTGAITQYVDVAQLVLWAFWIFFAGLIVYLVRENHREGYPMVADGPREQTITGWPVPRPKTYRLADGREVNKPDFVDNGAVYQAEPGHGHNGAPLVPVGDPMLAQVGPGAYVRRADDPDVDLEGQPRIAPLRDLPGFGVSAKDVDPRGLTVFGADGEPGGQVVDLWLDRMEMLYRYLEVQTESSWGPRRVLVPMNFARVRADGVRVKAIHGAQFARAPGPRQPDKVTLLEEDRICAYFGAGTLYADASRAEPLF